MGIKSSSQSMRQYEQMIEQFEVLQECQNEGLRYLQEKSTKRQFLLREISCHDKESYSNMDKVMRNRMKQLQNNRHVASLVRLINNSQDQYCMTFYKLYALFEFPQRTLDDEINQRNLQKRKFQEKQLWSILASCILGLSHLQKNNIKHCTLKSSTILISHDGVIKIYDPITTGCSNNYDTLLNHRQTPHIYLSPEQADSLKQEKVHAQYNPYKADIWNLGMIILQAGLLNYQDQCYRDQCSRLHWDTLLYHIKLFHDTYSDELTNLIQFMLGKDERSRPDWSQLEQHVIKVDQDVRGSQINQNPSSSDLQKDLYFDPPIANQIQNPKTQANNYEQIISNPSTKRTQNQIIQQTPPSNIIVGNVSSPYRPLSSKIGITRSKIDDRSAIVDRSTMIVGSLPSIIHAPLSNSQFSLIRPSDISTSRPLRNVFPASIYVTQTQVDQNLIMISQDQRDSDFDDSIRSNNTRIQEEAKIHYTPYHPPQNIVQSNNFNYSNQVRPNFSLPQTVNYQKQQPILANLQPQYHQIGHPLPYSPLKNINKQEGQYVCQDYKQGSRYEGYKLNNAKHGFGKFYYQDGGLYEGQWRFNKMEGVGKLYYQSDRLAYDGEWHNDQFSGRGILYNQFPQPLGQTFDCRNFDQIEQFWTKYQGQFLEDMKHGWGVLYLSNGQYFEGQFRNDFADGMGTFTTIRGSKIKGRWQNNKME